ncbi:MAG: substrate-binding domain-containing protein, partial [Cytophagales bacterium]|nr:substrate-binding domain-containing protein [Armatimonadota bacterium]
PPGCTSVLASEADVVHLALSHLWDLGHRKIALLPRPAARPYRQVPLLPSPYETIFTNWCLGRGIFDPTRILASERHENGPSLPGMDPPAALIEMLRDALSGGDPPTAIFAPQEGIGPSLIRAVQALGIPVPQVLSLVGVDTENGLMARAHVPLTCVELPHEAIGRCAVLQMSHLLEAAPPSSNPAPITTVPVSRLVRRASAATPFPR